MMHVALVPTHVIAIEAGEMDVALSRGSALVLASVLEGDGLVLAADLREREQIRVVGPLPAWMPGPGDVWVPVWKSKPLTAGDWVAAPLASRATRGASPGVRVRWSGPGSFVLAVVVG